MLTISGSNSNVDFTLLAVRFTLRHLVYKVEVCSIHRNVHNLKLVIKCPNTSTTYTVYIILPTTSTTAINVHSSVYAYISTNHPPKKFQRAITVCVIIGNRVKQIFK